MEELQRENDFEKNEKNNLFEKKIILEDQFASDKMNLEKELALSK
jgi:hypothetical protein